MTLPARWSSHLKLLAAVLAASAVLGAWFGLVGWWLTGALLVYLAFTLRHLYLLDRALEGYRTLPVFETRGLWAEVFARVSRLHAKARSRKKRYQRLLREVRESTGALADGGIILNADNEMVWFNPAAARLLGLDATNDMGQRIDNLLRQPDFGAYLRAPTADGITVVSPRRESGWLHVQIIPYGTVQRLAIVRDVTNEKGVERMRRDFVANASHELRSPLTVVSGYIETMAEDAELPEAWRVPVTEMQRQAERMTRIIRDLIELTRLESAEASAGRERVDVVALLRLIVQEFQGKPGPRVELAVETDAVLLGKEPDLHSVFHNLINNAVRFTPASGSVRVVWRADADAAVFEVADTGIGIPEEQIPRITERFYRVDPGRSRASGGTGLGLAIVKHALQRHEADLTIQSREGEGSTFGCRFPEERVVFPSVGARAVL